MHTPKFSIFTMFFLWAFTSFGQQVTIAGYVQDSLSGERLNEKKWTICYYSCLLETMVALEIYEDNCIFRLFLIIFRFSFFSLTF